MPSAIRVDWEWATGPGGTTPPFKTGYWVFDTSDDTAAVLSASTAWLSGQTTFRGYFSSAMGAPVVTARAVIGGIVVESSGTGVAMTGGAPDLPGASLRALLLGSRPEGGRNPSMFWPCLSGTVTDAAGALGSTEKTNSNTALNGLINTMKIVTPGSERYLAAVHRVGGGPTTITEVTSIQTQPTMSWLQRRYR
jgi:hypothetical protein